MIRIVAVAAFFVVASPSFAVEHVQIKWDGSYSYNKSTQYNPKLEPNSVANIGSGHSRNFQNGAAQEGSRVAKDGELLARLYKPSGNGPFPFVVFMHGCGGIGHTTKWTDDLAIKLNASGIGLLSLDSFSTRGVSLVCGVAGGHWMRRRADDAYSALDYLVSNGLADRGNAYLMGHSNGGSTTLVAAEDRYLERKNRFAAFIPLEPTCRTMNPKHFYGPVFMVLAELDEWTDNKRCFGFQKVRNPKQPFQITVIKGTHHGYLFPGAPVRVSNLNGFKFGHDPIGSLVGLEIILNFVKSPKVDNKIEYK